MTCHNFCLFDMIFLSPYSSQHVFCFAEPKLLMTKKLSASVQGTESCQKLQLDAGRANDSKLNLELRESVKQVLQHFPDGISLSNFAETYKVKYLIFLFVSMIKVIIQ